MSQIDKRATHVHWHVLFENYLRTYLRDCLQEPHDVLDMVKNNVEQLVVRIVLEHCNGNQSKAARVLGISRSTLHHRLKKHTA